MGFYEEIAGKYDAMTRFHERMPREIEMLKGWVERYHWSSVADVACGTGIHAIILANLGLRVVGADPSEAMLAQARIHAEEFGAQLSWIRTPMEHARQHIKDEYDAVICLGNSLPHLLISESFQAAVKNFYRLLKPEGIVVIQLLNYHRILAEQKRIIGIHRQEATEFIRFYDFLPDNIRFNILTIQWQDGKATHTLKSTPLYPYQRHEIEQMLSQQGFGECEYYGDMYFHPFEADVSPNLVVVGKKELTP
jgi:ubiquinone/menaquinone biosynthesis C-methylase UbiE